MDTTSITNQITAFKALTQEAAITPASLGTLLQAITDSLTSAALQTDTTALQQWQKNIKGIGSLLMSAQVQSSTAQSLVLGFYEASLTSGVPKLSARMLSLPTATSERAGVMTADQVETLDLCAKQCTSEQANFEDVKAQIPNAATYATADRRIDLKRSDNTLFSITLPLATESVPGLITTAEITSQIPNAASYAAADRRIDLKRSTNTLFSLTLPLATASVPGLVTTAETTSLRNKLATQQTLVRELGNFGSEAAALEAISAVGIAGDQSFAIAHCTYQGEISVILVQNVVNDYCRQVIFNKDKVFHRAVYFTSSERSDISYMEDWTPLFTDRLHWDSSAHKYVPSLFGLTFNADYTDAIPLATTAQDGLMTAAQVQQLNRIENKLNALLGTNS